MRRFTVEIDEGAFDALQTLAVNERRDVRDQAALLLERVLRPTAKTRERSTENVMDADEYQLQAMNFASPKSDLCCAALGLCGESGEFADLVKKMFYQDHDLDYEKATKELGDVLWYVALACEQLGTSMGIVMEENIDKLTRRYPSGEFDPERSKNRED